MFIILQVSKSRQLSATSLNKMGTFLALVAVYDEEAVKQLLLLNSCIEQL